MIRSGIVPIDELCDGFRSRSSYLLTGGAGAGKTSCVLQFVNQGLRSGEPVVLVTHSSRQDLFAIAERLGIDLRPAIREERAIVLRYRPDFTRRLSRAGTIDHVFDELGAVITKYRPRRIAIDTFAPLLDDGSPSPVAASALAELLDRSQATALLTYPADLGDGYDRRLEPIVQPAAGIFRLTRGADRSSTIEVLVLRHPSIDPRSSLAPIIPAATASVEESLIGATKPVQLICLTDEPSDDLLATLRLQHDVVIVNEESALDSSSDAGALVIATDHTTLERARAHVRSRVDCGLPIVVISRFNLRSLDRARLLRDGADEVLAGDMGAPELLQRLATALSRGHLSRPPHAVHEDETLTHKSLARSGELLDRERFRAAIRAHSAHDDAVPFTVVRLTTEDGASSDRRAIGALVLEVMRAASGDLAALLEDGIAVYLHGASRRDVAPFVDRLRARRSVGAAALRVEAASFPGDGASVRQLVDPLEVR